MEKVLIVSSVYPPEPVVSARVSFDLAKELVKSTFVTVLCPPPSRPLGYGFEAIKQEKNIERIEVNSYVYPKSKFFGRLRESYSFGKAVADYIKLHKKEISVIYIVSWPFFATYMPIRVAYKNNIPIIVSITDIYPESMTSRLGIVGRILELPLKFIDAYYLKRATLIISISELAGELIEKSRNLPAQKVEIVRIWQEDKSCDISCNDKDSDFTFMFVGSISPAANVPFIIKAFKSLNLSNSRLLIIGDGSEKDKCIKLSEGQENILFDVVVPEKVPEIQAMSDALLLSLKPGVGKTATPSKLPAYMFSAKPIVASLDVDSDAAYIINKSGCGFVCGANDLLTFQTLLRNIYAMPKHERDTLGKKGYYYAEKYLSKRINLEKIVSLVLANRKRR